MMPNLLPQYFYAQTTPQNNDSIQIAPTIQEDDETDELANQKEDALQQVMTLLQYVPSNLELCTLNSS